MVGDCDSYKLAVQSVVACHCQAAPLTLQPNSTLWPQSRWHCSKLWHPKLFHSRCTRNRSLGQRTHPQLCSCGVAGSCFRCRAMNIAVLQQQVSNVDFQRFTKLLHCCSLGKRSLGQRFYPRRALLIVASSKIITEQIN